MTEDDSTARESATEGDPLHGIDFRCLDFCPICRTADVMRASAPPELQEQWQILQRELLEAARAVAEAALDRLDDQGKRRADTDDGVEDIPIA